MTDYRYAALSGTVTDQWEDASLTALTRWPHRVRAYLVTALAALAVIGLAGLALDIFAPASAPAVPVMPAVAMCQFDGGGMAVAGSVTRTTDGRAWLCTEDGTLVPWHAPASR